MVSLFSRLGSSRHRLLCDFGFIYVFLDIERAARELFGHVLFFHFRQPSSRFILSSPNLEPPILILLLILTCFVSSE